jgi:hypothetical protein
MMMALPLAVIESVPDSFYFMLLWFQQGDST